MHIPARLIIVVLAAAAAILSGCSSEPEAPPRSAEQVVGDLAAQVPSARPAVVYTAESDPNRLLGRPGQYTSAASFTDTRVPAELAGGSPGSVEAGGKVEVFASEAEVTRRKQYIDQIAQASPLAVEWSYISGNTLVRVSRGLTEPQAQEYRAALG